MVSMVALAALTLTTLLAQDVSIQQASSGLRDATNRPPAETRPDLTPEVRGDIAMARKDYRQAIDHYREAAPSAVMLNKIGIAYHQLLDLKNARKSYEQAIKLNPKYSEAINNLGTIHYAQKSYRRAITQYRRALQLAPQSASILSNLGTAYFARKQYAEATEAYQKALQLDPEVFEHRGTMGVVLQERSVEDRAKFYYFMAKTYAKAGVEDRTIQYIRRALEQGFKEKQKFAEEPEFAFIKENAEFKQIMATEQKVL